MLYHHNIHRANHSVAAMEWDATLAQYAHNSASKCVWEHDMYVYKNCLHQYKG